MENKSREGSQLLGGNRTKTCFHCQALIRFPNLMARTNTVHPFKPWKIDSHTRHSTTKLETHCPDTQACCQPSDLTNTRTPISPWTRRTPTRYKSALKNYWYSESAKESSEDLTSWRRRGREFLKKKCSQGQTDRELLGRSRPSKHLAVTLGCWRKARRLFKLRQMTKLRTRPN